MVFNCIIKQIIKFMTHFCPVRPKIRITNISIFINIFIKYTNRYSSASLYFFNIHCNKTYSILIWIIINIMQIKYWNYSNYFFLHYFASYQLIPVSISTFNGASNLYTPSISSLTIFFILSSSQFLQSTIISSCT